MRARDSTCSLCCVPYIWVFKYAIILRNKQTNRATAAAVKKGEPKKRRTERRKENEGEADNSNNDDDVDVDGDEYEYERRIYEK